MRKSLLLITAGIFAFNSATIAHDPPDFLAPVWQWPAGAVPVIDADLSEYDIVPDEFWIGPDDLIQSLDTGDALVHQGDPDPASWDIRFLMSWNDESNRIYYALDKFDDFETDTAGDSFELGLDADHSGGSFWAGDELEEDEMYRERARHAQSHTWYFTDDCGTAFRGPYGWSHFWMTPADWFGEPEYTDHAYEYVVGSPCNFSEVRKHIEWYQVYWDDFNWEDPDAPRHDFEVDEIFGMNPRFNDGDCSEEDTNNENCGPGTRSKWQLTPANEVFGDSDFFADFILLDVAEDFPTAVGDDSWGRVKASVAK
jgi:hypothetical protein